MGIISGSVSFRGRFGDHFLVGDHFGVGIISGDVQVPIIGGSRLTLFAGKRVVRVKQLLQ